MPDIDVLNIINLNIHSIGIGHDGGNDNCCTNMANAQSADTMQKTNRAEKCYTNTDNISKFDNTDMSMVNNKLSNTIDYFLLGPSHSSDKKKSGDITQQHQIDFEDVFTGIGCFDGMFSPQLKQDSMPYQVPPTAYGIHTRKTF